MMTSLSVVFILLALPYLSYAQNCSFPDELAGTWLYSDGDSGDGKKLELNSENYTETVGDDSKTSNCFMSVPDNSTYIIKMMNGDQTSYKCLAYKKINSNVFIGYTTSPKSTDEEPSDVYSYCGDLLKFPTPGNVFYNANDMNAVQCSITGKYEWQNDDCSGNETSKLEVCSGEYKSIQYTEACDEVQAPLINGSMDCLASWENSDGLQYALARTAEVKDGESSWKGKFVCIAHKIVNNTLKLTARDFECDASQTDSQLTGNGLTAEMKQVSGADECVPPSTTEGASSLSAGFTITISFILATITALKA